MNFLILFLYWKPYILMLNISFQVAGNSEAKLQTRPPAGCYRQNIHPLPFVLLLSHKANSLFTVPWRVGGWVDLGTAVRVRSLCPKWFFCEKHRTCLQRGFDRETSGTAVRHVLVPPYNCKRMSLHCCWQWLPSTWRTAVLCFGERRPARCEESLGCVDRTYICCRHR